jgi:hypothetical protein
MLVRRVMEPPEELESALRHRVRAAARAAVRRARVLGGRPPAPEPLVMLRRCAWCSRVEHGGAWVEPSEAERAARKPEVSDTICPDCSQRLVREGKSH